MEEDRTTTITQSDLDCLNNKSDIVALLKCFTEGRRLPPKDYNSKTIESFMEIVKNILALRV